MAISPRGRFCILIKPGNPRARSVLRTLWQREMVHHVYQPRMLAARRKSGGTVQALAFVADPKHPQFAGEMDITRMARAVAHGRGGRGPNIDYLRLTLAHMHRLGVPDQHPERVLALADRFANMRGQDRPCGV